MLSEVEKLVSMTWDIHAEIMEESDMKVLYDSLVNSESLASQCLKSIFDSVFDDFITNEEHLGNEIIVRDTIRFLFLIQYVLLDGDEKMEKPTLLRVLE